MFEGYLVIPYFLVIQDRISRQENPPEEINKELKPNAFEVLQNRSQYRVGPSRSREICPAPYILLIN